METKRTRFTFEHTIILNTGEKTLPYRSARWWKTVRGALNAAREQASSLETRYMDGSVNTHELHILSDQQELVFTEAA